MNLKTACRIRLNPQLCDLDVVADQSHVDVECVDTFSEQFVAIETGWTIVTEDTKEAKLIASRQVLCRSTSVSL